ncbi:TBC1 domain family member 15-like isoform X1 [Tachypleus tridentatus]|uniref:TBC1 domain family member 15-like isoform X1 n=1 Tax=Tachypleus tridentatus TaxID=6853 RepID=UPI003FD14134
MMASNGNIAFVHDGVCVCVSGPHKEPIFTGRVTISEQPYGGVLEWHANEEVNETGKLLSSPETENLDWEDVASGFSAEYKPHSSQSNESIGLKLETTKKPQTISFDVADLKSYKCLQKKKGKGSEVTFFLKDGSTPPTLYFPKNNHICLINALEKYIQFRRSAKDINLYIVHEPQKEALEKSFSELQLFREQSSDLVKRFFDDPYTATMGGFSKVTNFLLDYVLTNENSPTKCSNEEVVQMLQESLPSVEINQNEEPGFEVITCMELPPRPQVKRDDPVLFDQWESHIDSEGQVTDIEQLKCKIFKGGLLNSLRKEVWKFLLGYFPFNSTRKEREKLRKKKIDDYYKMKLQWKSITPEQETRFSAFRERKNLIEKDVSRTDRTHPYFMGTENANVQLLYDILMTYCMYNFDLGYVQGMSDLLSPVLVVMENEADAFWCFAEFMENVGSNFELDQQGMKTQLQQLYSVIHFADPHLCDYLESHDSGNLYFCFRWLLILFKREFKFHDIMRLWEVLWTGLPCRNFHLLICLAILDAEKNTLMENQFGLPEILKHINDMSYKINPEEVLCRAESIYLQLSQCQHLPQSLQDILGIQAPASPSLLSSIVSLPPSTALAPIEENRHSSSVPVPINKTSSTLDRFNASPPSGNSSVENSSIEVLPEDSDIEARYQISFDLML